LFAADVLAPYFSSSSSCDPRLGSSPVFLTSAAAHAAVTNLSTYAATKGSGRNLGRAFTVGSVALSGDALSSLRGESSSATGIDDLLDRLERDEFDLVAVGRALLVDPAWTRKVQEARYDELLPFEPAALATLS
jgi:2,4-dienoyl-CoA reductase-like NADH-dependent reductase (Old Yellow Enzyme family)